MEQGANVPWTEKGSIRSQHRQISEQRLKPSRNRPKTAGARKAGDWISDIQHDQDEQGCKGHSAAMLSTGTTLALNRPGLHGHQSARAGLTAVARDVDKLPTKSETRPKKGS
jgi:hypothetical protein